MTQGDALGYVIVPFQGTDIDADSVAERIAVSNFLSPEGTPLHSPGQRPGLSVGTPAQP